MHALFALPPQSCGQQLVLVDIGDPDGMPGERGRLLSRISFQYGDPCGNALTLATDYAFCATQPQAIEPVPPKHREVFSPLFEDDVYAVPVAGQHHVIQEIKGRPNPFSTFSSQGEATVCSESPELDIGASPSAT